MVVVIHEAIGMAKPLVTIQDMGKGVEESITILVAEEDGLASVATACDVVQRTWKL